MPKRPEAHEHNFFKYYFCINIIGQIALQKLLKWFYKGGDANYLDYLLSHYDISDIEGLINSNQRKALKHTSRVELDMPLLHIFMQLSCSFYDEIEQNENCDEGYKVLSSGVEKLVLARMNIGNTKPYLTDMELLEKIRFITDILETLMIEGRRLSNSDYDECREVIDESIRVMSLDSKLETYDQNLLSKESWEKLISAKKQSQKLIALNGKLESSNHFSSCYSDILEHKFTVSAIKYKRTHRLKEAVVTEQEAQGSQALCDDEELEEKGRKTCNAKEIQSNKETRKVLTAKRNCGSSTTDEKSTSDESLSESNATTESIRSRILAALTPVKSNHMHMYLGGHLPPYTDIDIFLKQHQKYSRKPGQRVQLQDLLTVKGMSSDVAEIIIVSGGPGTGKTMLVECISKRYQNAVDLLCTRDILLSSDLKKNSCSTFSELILNSMKDEMGRDIEKETLRKTVLELSVLIMLDGYDESSEESSQLVKEVLDMYGTDLRIIITCRPQYVDTIYHQIPLSRRKYVSHLSLNGVPLARHAEFVSQLIDNQISGEAFTHKCQHDRIKEGLINRLPEIYDVLGDDLCNPFLLKIIATMWVENPHIELQ